MGNETECVFRLHLCRVGAHTQHSLSPASQCTQTEWTVRSKLEERERPRCSRAHILDVQRAIREHFHYN